MHRFSRHWSMPLWMGLFAFLLALVTTLIKGEPAPEVHDEFSYLLAADTFAHGRLTNPTHPMWKHLEAFHVIQHPTYQSKYQPGQGLLLALGQATMGTPIAGAWLGIGLASAAIAWALRAMLPARWALFGGMLAATHPLMLSWSQNYWGGTPAALGGALVFGAAARLRYRSTPLLGAAAALGIGILFNTRPYEGLIFAGLVTTPLLLHGIGRPHLRSAAAAASVLAAVAAWNGYYNYRVTGYPTRLPYLEHEAQYALAPPLIIQPEPTPKTYANPLIQRYNQDVELAHYRRQRTLAGFLAAGKEKLWILTKAYGAMPVVWLGVIGATLAIRRRPWARRGVAILCAFIAVLMLSNWTFAHYAAPALALFIAITTAGVRELCRGRRWLLTAASLLLVASASHSLFSRAVTPASSWGRTRETLIATLQTQPGDDLVLVRPNDGDVRTDMVHNDADIDASPVVFARDMGRAANAELIAYFKTRTAWLLDEKTGKIDRYESKAGED